MFMNSLKSKPLKPLPDGAAGELLIGGECLTIHGPALSSNTIYWSYAELVLGILAVLI